MARLEIVPFSDAHLDAAAELLAARHERHRAAEPLLPELTDPRAAVEAEWRQDDASGAFAGDAYLIASPQVIRNGPTWMRVGIAGHAVAGEPEIVRDVYAAAAERWVEEGRTKHAVFVPSFDSGLVDAWFRLCFGASAALAMREIRPETEEPFDAGVTIRPGTPDDYTEAARLELEMSASMRPAPSFSDMPLQTHDEVLVEWREDDDSDAHELFVAEGDGRIVGHILLYRRPPDLRVPENSIDLAQASTEPRARGTGVGRALTAHVIHWAHEHGYALMTTDWRMTNLWASRFWPKRGFRPTFLRLYRSIP